MKSFSFPRRVSLLLGVGLMAAAVLTAAVSAQDQSVKPGINKSYVDPKVERTVKSFERESRDVVQKLDQIVAACQLKPGMHVADAGAGTGLFTRPFARKVAPEGKVYAVDIATKFIQYIRHTCQEQGITNVVGVVCTADSTKLAPESVDLVFLCDTYHHFEYPYKMLASIYRSLRPGGRLVIVDYEKEEGVSPEWVFGHVRADKKTAVQEITDAGFTLTDELDILKLQYVLRFEKSSQSGARPPRSHSMHKPPGDTLRTRTRP